MNYATPLPMNDSPSETLRAAVRQVIASPVMEALIAEVDLFAASELPVLVLGETGVGKEVIGERIHRSSRRADGPLVKLNCASLTETVVESELFGHEKGAFTGAVTRRVGVFESADGGTLFLDELGELSLRTQAKLLRTLESGELVPVGGCRARRVDVRIVGATHRDLEQLVAEGLFREDLYFRLGGAILRIPPLRQRTSEIVPLAESFADRAARRSGIPTPRLTQPACDRLLAHDWPGNVRELRLVMERAVILARGGSVTPAHLDFCGRRPALRVLEPVSPACPEPPPSGELPIAMRDQVKTFERERILAALQQTGGNQTRAACLLGISRRTLTNKLNRYGLERPRKRPSS
ncbi:MAG TPA: sigma-54 dependent transcriptional regulator [Polyangiaceae bacterium]|jgi:transcriptional regulator with GAF, ATPase, and Fis domain